MILNQYLKGRNFLTLIVILVFGYTLNAQDSPKESAYIDNKLVQIDSLINVGQYEQASKLITTTLNTFSFKRNSEEQLSFEYRNARNYYGQGNNEKAMEMFNKVAMEHPDSEEGKQALKFRKFLKEQKK